MPIAGFEMPELKQSLRPGESLLGEAGGDVVSELSSEARQDNMGRLASEAIRRLSLPSQFFPLALTSETVVHAEPCLHYSPPASHIDI